MKKWALNSFNRGWFGALACFSLIQDWYGKEAYLARVNENWTEWYITIPLAGAVVLWCVISKFSELNEPKK